MGWDRGELPTVDYPRNSKSRGGVLRRGGKPVVPDSRDLGGSLVILAVQNSCSCFANVGGDKMVLPGGSLD